MHLNQQAILGITKSIFHDFQKLKPFELTQEWQESIENQKTF